ncbi:hypothetical protein ACS0TY_022654 [Phlomoides rotata]
MKRGKDEMIKGPMFPRLHVNDTEKRGPRAPPRNKMALYEQFSIPSQRFNHSNNKAANLEPPSKQGVANEHGMFFSYQLPTRHQFEKPHDHYSDFTIPLAQVNQRKKLDADDFRVPIFFQSREICKHANNLNKEKLSPSDPFNFSRQLNFHEVKKTSGMRQEEATSLSSSGTTKQYDSSMYCEPRDSCANSIDRLEVHDAVEHHNINSSAPIRASLSDEQRGFCDLRNDTGYQDKSFRSSVHTTTLERVDSVSETSVVDSISRLDITPDEVVEIIGQKHFWKARKAILNQQRLFAVQVFELHRLVKVQRSIAEVAQNLADDSGYLGKPTKSSPSARIPVKAVADVPKQKDEADKLNQMKENSADDTIEKPSFSSVQKGVPPPSYQPLNGSSPVPSVSSNQNAMPWSISQPQGHQWLIPVMTPSEGLVYKPYPGPGCTGFGPPGPGPGPMPSNFLPPVCGIPAPHPQYPLPYFHPAGPHGYFPPYGLPMMDGDTFSVSSVEQNSSHKNRASPDVTKDVEVQASAVGRPNRRLEDSGGRDDTEQTDVLPLFPTSPATSSCPRRSKPEGPVQVIKVVPHNARSATESAARIFRSIQEERKQVDSM